MDYTHEHSISEIEVHEPFRGWLTRLLAEAFYLEEEEIEIPETKQLKQAKDGDRLHLLGQYAKPF